MQNNLFLIIYYLIEEAAGLIDILELWQKIDRSVKYHPSFKKENN